MVKTRCYHDRPSPTLAAIFGSVSKLRSQASLHGVNHNLPFPTALKSIFSTFSVLSPKACPYVMIRQCVECRKDENETIARTGIGDAASCETPCKRKSQSDWAQLGDKNIVWRRASERVGYDYEEKILIPQPTLSEAPVVSTLLSPSCASLQARTLAWCFASFGISDAFTCAFIYPLPPTR